MNGHLKRVLILLLIFTFVFQMAGVTSLSSVQAYAETEEAVLDISDAEEAEDVTTEETDTGSPGEIETDGENPPDEATEPSAPEAASEEPAEVPEETPAEETITVEEPAEEPAPTKAPVLKAATKAEKTGTVLAFTSDTHNKEGNIAAKRLGDWVEMVESKHGDIDVMAFGGDMAGAGERNYWDLTQADFNMLASKDVPGVYTTGNHEISTGGDFKYSSYIANSYLPTETKGQFVIDEEVAVGDDYRIYCLGSRSDSQAYPEDQRNALDDYLTNVGNDKVIFIITHFPLHYYGSGYSRSTTGASEMIELLNNAVTNNGQTIVFLWGHNHTLSDTYYDQIYGPGGVDSIQYSSSSSSKKTIKFYYGGAGCMSDTENGGGSEFVKGKGLVATITPAGENSILAFKYYNEGGTDVTESNSVKSVNVEITEPIPATGVTIDEAATTGDDGQATGVSIAAGKTLKLHLTLEPAGASSSGITWSSSDETIATVSNSGLVTAKKEGTAIITAAIPSGTRAAGPTSSIEITVTAAPKEVSITPASSNSPTENATIEVGETLTINVTNGSSSAYNYTATLSDSGVAEIQGKATVNITGSGTGQFAVKGLTAGTVDITIQNNGQFSNRKGTIHLTVIDSGGDDPTPTQGDRYVPATNFTADKDYIVAVDKGNGKVDVLKNAGSGSLGSVELTVGTENGTDYVATADTSVVWKYTTDTRNRISNSSRYLTINSSSKALETDTTGNYAITYNSNSKIELKYPGSSSGNIYYIQYADGTFSATSANASENAATIRLFVKDEGSVPVTGVSLNKNTLALEAGESETLTANVQPADATNKAVTWSSSNESVATVSNGTVTAVGAGEATITVTTADSGKTATCTVTVAEAQKTKYVEVNELEEGKNYIVAVTKDANTVYVIRNNNGSLASAELAVTKNGNEAAYVETGNASVVWKFNGGTDNLLSNQANYYLNITNSGTARDLYISTSTAYGVGYTNSHLYLRYFSESTSEYYVLCNNGTFSAGAKNVSSNAATIRLFEEYEPPVSVTEVSLNKNSLSLAIGGTETLTATVKPDEATNKNVSWSTEDPTIATVDNNGKVTGLAVGETTITATTEDGGKTASCTVTVTDRQAYVIVIGDYALSTDPTEDQLVNSGSGTQQYIYHGLAGIEYTSGSPASNNIRWYVIETTGGYYIKSMDGRYLNATYTANDTGGSTGVLKLDNTSDVWTITRSFENWTINGSALKSTNAGKSLTHEETSGSESINLFTVRSTGETSVLKEATNPIAVTGVTLDKNSAEIKERKTVQLTATVIPEDATNKNVTWESSDITVASVDETGLVTGKKVGTATITVKTVDGNYSATCVITVVEGDPIQGRVIMVDGYALSHESADPDYFQVNGTNNKYYGLKAVSYDTSNEPDESILWIVTPAGESGYYITDPNGNYLNATYASSTSSGSTTYEGHLKLDNTSDIWVLEDGVDLDSWILTDSTLKSTNATASDAATSENKEIFLARETGSVNSTNIITIRSGNSADDTSLIDPEHPIVKETRFVETTTLTNGEKYIIAVTKDGDSGKVYAINNSGGSSSSNTTTIELPVVSGGEDPDYIVTTETGVPWEYSTGSSNRRLANQTRYLAVSNNALRASGTGYYITYSASDTKNTLTLKSSSTSSTTYYLTLTNGTLGVNTSSSNAANVRLFVETEVIIPGDTHTHTYGEPTWTWAEGNTSATATFTCTEGDDTQTVTDSAPVETVVTAAGCETNKVVKYTATVTFNGEQYTNDTDNITVPDSALGHDYGEPVWTWDGFTAATAKFTCANDASHTQTVNATITSAAQGGVTTYTATAAFEGQTYTDQKADTSMLITEASATFTYPIVGDDVAMGRKATVPEGANYSVYVYEYKDANGNKLTTGTFEAGKTYYAEYTFDADHGYGFKGGAADTSGQVPAPEDRVALTINGTDATSLIDAAYTYSRVLVYVQFTPENPEFNLTISNYGESGADGTAALSATKAHRGDEITVTATPAAGSVFEYAEYKRAGSEENATRIGTDGKFIMPPYDVEVTAVFIKAEYTVTVTSNNEAYGTASASYQSWYNMGDEVTLTATANEGYEFKEWNVISGGVDIVNDKFNVGTENVEIQAVFAPKEYTLTFKDGDEVITTITQGYGTAVTAPAAPTKAFYTFNGWTPEIPETMPAEDKTFNATWTAKDAYYLVGSMNNWTVSETYEFVASPQNPGEYTVAATLTANDEIKVVKAVAGVKDESNYYPSTEHQGASGQTGNYIVDQYHAGGVTVYFRPAGNTDEGWQDFGGYFYIEGDHAVTVETSPANSGTAQVVRGDGSGAATSAPKGMSLTVNATPADNYQLDKIEIWKTNGGTEAEETLEGNTFNMPDYDVTVKVYFKVVKWTFVDFTWEQTIDGYKAVANYTGDDGSTKTVNAEVTAKTTAATCEEAGETVYTATIAQDVSLDGEAHNATKTVVIPAAGHTYGDLIAVVPATCTTDGVKAHYECSVCHQLFDADKTETTAEALKIAATGHDWSYKNFTWTGDEETGYTAATVHYVCRNDADHTRAINVTVTSETNAPTCENAGSTVYTATVAAADSPDGIGHTDTRTVVIPATEHSWKFVNFTWTGNDEEGYTAAVANYKCENDEEHTQTVNATVTSETTAASCEVAGSTVYTATVAAADSLDGKVCTDTKTVEIPATGHKWVKPAEWTWIGDDENGYTGIRGTFTCENDPEHTREVQSTEEVTVKRVEPTATQAGSITYTVNVTGPNGVVYEVEKEIIIPPAGYTFKNPVYTWTKTTDGYSVAALKECNEDPAQNITETVTATYAVTTPATCKDGGVGTYTAAFTKSDFTTQTKPEDIPATGHTPVTDAAVAPTCTETGLTEGSHCSVCGDILTAQETVPALGHDWRQPTGVWNSDHTSVVLTFVCNRDAKHTETVTASGSAITSEVTTEPTATTPGERTYTATVTFDGKTYTLSDTEAIPVTGSSVSGNITSFVGNTAEGEVTVQLFAAGSETAAYTATVTGNTSYAFAGVANGTYTLTVSKKDHVTRSYEITVAGSAVTQDVKIHLLGDVNGDGKLTTGDVSRVNSHVRKVDPITDEYLIKCADVLGTDGTLTTGDVSRINSHVRKESLLW